MSLKKFPSVIYVQSVYDQNDTENGLIAWATKDSPDDGRVATYQLIEEYDKRTVSELRRRGTKAWVR